MTNKDMPDTITVEPTVDGFFLRASDLREHFPFLLKRSCAGAIEELRFVNSPEGFVTPYKVNDPRHKKLPYVHISGRYLAPAEAMALLKEENVNYAKRLDELDTTAANAFYEMLAGLGFSEADLSLTRLMGLNFDEDTHLKVSKQLGTRKKSKTIAEATADKYIGRGVVIERKSSQLNPNALATDDEQVASAIRGMERSSRALLAQLGL
jgi:hypothetical protein